MKEITQVQRDQLLVLQQEEINGYHTYNRLSKLIKDKNNSKILKRIADEEFKHYKIWKKYTQQEIAPDKWKIHFFFWVSKLFGLTFGIRLMELGEEKVQIEYESLLKAIPEAADVLADEEKHEDELLDMLDEQSLQYAGSVVLGLNDALVELTGALAGLTFAFQNTNLIALAGLITGISEYLSVKSDESGQDPIRSALYTGIAYVFTVIMLILPYLLATDYYISLAWTIVNAILIIAVFNYYISVVRGYNFRKRFLEMASISLGVALLSFVIGNLIRTWIGIDI